MCQFQKHNFAHNFLNAVETDKMVAWDVLVNEVNELILDHPQAVRAALEQSGIKIQEKPTARQLLDAVHGGIYENDKLRPRIMRLIAKRHTDPHFSADGGAFDMAFVDGSVKEDFNMSGDNSSSEDMLSILGSGLKNLVQNAGDKVRGAAQKLASQDKAQKSLAAKEKQRNLSVSKPKAGMSTGKIIAVSLAAAAAVSLIAYMIYKSTKTEQA